MAPAYDYTPTTAYPERGYTGSTTSGYLRSYNTDTSIDYEYTYTKVDEAKEVALVKYYMWLENRLESIDTTQALARMKRRIEDVCARQFIHKVMSIRQPKPKSRLRAKLYK